MKLKTIMHLMVGLSRRHLRPKPIDFLLPWLHRRDIKSRRRILVNIWSLNTKSHRLNCWWPRIIILPLHHWIPNSWLKRSNKKFDARKDISEMEMELMPIFSIPYKRNLSHEDDTCALARRGWIHNTDVMSCLMRSKTPVVMLWTSDSHHKGKPKMLP